MPRPLRILMVSAEVETFARTGGLGDVVLGLSKALGRRGAEVVVVTPRYGITKVPAGATWWWDPVYARVGWGPDDERRLGVLETKIDETTRVCLLAESQLFDRNGIYGDTHGTFGDNDYRFAVMSRAALSVADHIWGSPFGGGGPDVIHAHDWHAALSVVYAKEAMGDAWRNVPCVFTIHNLAYQGVMGFGALDALGIPRHAYRGDLLENFGTVNLMKGACALADRITTVSPTYAEEIRRPENGFGLDGFLRDRSYKTAGIVNGIDPERYVPDFSPETARSAKLEHKIRLGEELGLERDDRSPLFSSVSRLTSQKGIDLLLRAIEPLVQRGARVVLVGTGDDALENGLRQTAARFPGRVAARIAFDERLARRVYAASDFFVVPSRFEPCGLTQMYAMRYGAIPIVTDVGGLHDTVTPYEPAYDRGTGFVAASATATSLVVAFDDALTAWGDGPGMQGLITRAMG
ncbi:MAG TPA: glycogen/starch synthase, partial [Polyangiaceae bacterium]